jgi:hypothetical protein
MSGHVFTPVRCLCTREDDESLVVIWYVCSTFSKTKSTNVYFLEMRLYTVRGRRMKRSLSVAVVRRRMACWPMAVAVAEAVRPSPAQLYCRGLAALISCIPVTSDRYVVLCICSSYPFLTVPIPILGPTQPPKLWVLGGGGAFPRG